MSQLTPAQKHWQKTMAERRGEPETLSYALSAYEQTLHRLRVDQSRLKGFQATERKIEYKATILPNYEGYIDGVLASQSGLADEVFTTLMIWQIDTNNYARGLDMAEYAITHKLPLPDRYQRTLGTVLIDEICDPALAIIASGSDQVQRLSIDTLRRLQSLTESQDVPDEVRAKIFKTLAYTLRTSELKEDKAEALDYLQRAILLWDGVGVKRDIEQLTRELQKLEKAELPAADDSQTPSVNEPKKAASKVKAVPKKTTATRQKKAS